MLRQIIEGGYSYVKFNTKEMAEAARAVNHSDLCDAAASALRQAVHDREVLIKRVRQAVRELQGGPGDYAAALLRDALDLVDPEAAAPPAPAPAPAVRPPPPVAEWSAKAVGAGPGKFRGLVVGPKGVKFPAGTHDTIDAAWWAAERMCVDLMAGERAAAGLAQAMDAAAGMAVA